jgi:hypothetical protein
MRMRESPEPRPSQSDRSRGAGGLPSRASAMRSLARYQRRSARTLRMTKPPGHREALQIRSRTAPRRKYSEYMAIGAIAIGRTQGDSLHFRGNTTVSP